MGILQEIAKRAALKTAQMASREIPTAAEKTVGSLVPIAESPLLRVSKEVVENPSRRGFLKKAAASAARSAVPDSIAEPLMSYAAKKVLTEAPEVVQHVAAAEGLGLKEALAAVTKRIAEHNALAKQQATARAEAGIEGMIEGHQPVLKMLKPGTGVAEEDLTPITSLLKKVAPKIELTAQQKAENAAHRKAVKEYDLRSNDWDKANPYELGMDAKEYYARKAEDLGPPVWKWATPHEAEYDWDTIASDLISKNKPSKLSTGWGDIPELQHTYVPGVGHYVDPGAREMGYWLKSPESALPDDVILHEYLSTMKKFGAGD